MSSQQLQQVIRLHLDLHASFAGLDTCKVPFPLVAIIVPVWRGQNPRLFMNVCYPAQLPQSDHQPRPPPTRP